MKFTQSPVDDRFSAKLIAEYPSEKLRQAYEKAYGIDISCYIDADVLRTYACEGTGLQFFKGIKPGDGVFYEQLMRFEWYYNAWKWEHKMARELLSHGDTLLEIGCGAGGFLEGISDMKLRAEGIELNAEAVAICQKKNLEVTGRSLKEVANRGALYDWVMSFQVAEHVPDVGAFFKDSIALLRPGGRLLISVPNNKSFIGVSKGNPLNMPPHHMNLWDEDSLSAVGKHFGCNKTQTFFEPLQTEHVNWYVQTMLQTNQSEVAKILPVLRGWFFRKHRQFITDWVKREQNNILGHSILMVFQKSQL